MKMQTKMSLAWNIRSRTASSYVFLWCFAFSLLNSGAFGDDVGPTTATFEQQLTTAETTTTTHSTEWQSDWTTANNKDTSEEEEEERPSSAFAKSMAEDAVTREPVNTTRDTEHAGSTAGLSVEAQRTTGLNAGPRGDSDDGHVISEPVAHQSNAVDSETTGSTTETTVGRENGATRATKATDATADAANETTRPDDNGVETSHGEATHATTTASDYATAATATTIATTTTATTATTILIIATTTAHSDAVSTLTPAADINASSSTVHLPVVPDATTATTTATAATTTVLFKTDLAEDNSMTTETTAVEEQLLAETDEQNRATEVATVVILGDNEIFSSIPRSHKTTALVSGATSETTTTTTPTLLLRGSTNSTDNDGATVKTTTTQLRGTTKSNTADAFYGSDHVSTQTSRPTLARSTETSTVESTAAALNSAPLTSSFSCLVFVLFMRKMA